MKLSRIVLGVISLAVVSTLIAGCSMANDNPIDTNKMQKIREKQANEMKGYDPSKSGGQAPGAGAPSKGQ